jgi:biotin operon repressor
MIRRLTDEEHAAIAHGLRSPVAFTLRRSQILLASARGQTPPEISQQLGCSDQAVREAIQTFPQAGVTALSPKSKRPHKVPTTITSEQAHQIGALLHRRPREFGHATRLWTLERIVQVSLHEGILDQPVTGETIRHALLRLGIAGKRAKRWMTSPDPAYARTRSLAEAGTDSLRWGRGLR